MKAFLCRKHGPVDTMRVEEIDRPTIEDHEILVEAAAAAVNFPDLLMLEDKYQFKPELPFVPGGEGSGTVVEVGAGVKNFAVGDRVCGTCGWGSFAEYFAADAGRMIKMPDTLNWGQAAALTLTYATSYHALRDRAVLQAGETLLVLGAAGGVGLAAIELGRTMGATVIAAASSEEKLAVCKSMGAHKTLLYDPKPLDKDGQRAFSQAIKDATDGKGADVIYDSVGSSYAEPALRATAWEGRYLVVGFAAGEIPRIPLNLTLLKGCSIVGVFWGSFVTRENERFKKGMEELLDWVKQGHLNPHVCATFPLEQTADAMKMVGERRAQGKVVILTDKGRRESA